MTWPVPADSWTYFLHRYRSFSFACDHMSVTGVVSAGCGICGPLTAVA
jgi:hypothetical protein